MAASSQDARCKQVVKHSKASSNARRAGWWVRRFRRPAGLLQPTVQAPSRGPDTAVFPVPQTSVCPTGSSRPAAAEDGEFEDLQVASTSVNPMTSVNPISRSFSGWFCIGVARGTNLLAADFHWFHNLAGPRRSSPRQPRRFRQRRVVPRSVPPLLCDQPAAAQFRCRATAAVSDRNRRISRPASKYTIRSELQRAP